MTKVKWIKAIYLYHWYLHFFCGGLYCKEAHRGGKKEFNPLFGQLLFTDQRRSSFHSGFLRPSVATHERFFLSLLILLVLSMWFLFFSIWLVRGWYCNLFWECNRYFRIVSTEINRYKQCWIIVLKPHDSCTCLSFQIRISLSIILHDESIQILEGYNSFVGFKGWKEQWAYITTFF